MIGRGCRRWAVRIAGGLILGGCVPAQPAPHPSDPAAVSESAGPRSEAPAPAPSPAQAAAVPAVAPAPVPVWTPRPDDPVRAEHPIEFPHQLEPFFDRLAVIDDAAPAPAEDDLVRVVHLGASMIGNDDLPAVLRRRFQQRFGDGGAGLVLLSRYMPNYRHRWVELSASDWEHCYIGTLCKRDGHYGLGGATFWSDGGATTKIRTRDGELGDVVSHFEVWYAATRGGGKLEARVDRRPREVIDTRAEALADRFFDIDVAPGPHQITIRALGGGRVRAYGVVLESDGPGVVWDQFSMLGAFTKRMLAWDEEHIAGQIARRDPDLIVFTYGGNDLRRVATRNLTQAQYEREYQSAIARVRAGKPQAACLIIGITDRAKSLHFTIVPEHVETIVQAQREVARTAGCAFFDTYQAMGGGGSLQAWRHRRPPLAEGDLKHLTHAGRELLGGWIYDSLMAAYVAHRTAVAEPG